MKKEMETEEIANRARSSGGRESKVQNTSRDTSPAWERGQVILFGNRGLGREHENRCCYSYRSQRILSKIPSYWPQLPT